HVEVTTSTNRKYVFTLKGCPGFPCGQIGFSLPMRKWAELSLNQTLEVRPYTFNPNIQYIAKVVLEVDFLDKKTTLEPYDTEKMATEFVKNFCKQAFTVGQMLAFKNNSDWIIITRCCCCLEKAEGSAVNLVGKAKGKTARQSIINPDWDFQKMGIGGLDKEFNAIFRRAFASRVFPPEFVQQLGLKHVRGILLFGPPGTGKTLMARQIGQMLNAREPKIVNGPQILDKYVGESEANIRRLFAEAEEEEKRLGPNSGLHIIIFDEIDAICKARGSV
ncbi:vesicle-fusing ATPase 2, partial [Trichonephila clavata]